MRQFQVHFCLNIVCVVLIVDLDILEDLDAILSLRHINEIDKYLNINLHIQHNSFHIEVARVASNIVRCGFIEKFKCVYSLQGNFSCIPILVPIALYRQLKTYSNGYQLYCFAGKPFLYFLFCFYYYQM